MKDIFRPRSEPARTLYDAFQAEAEKRDGRSFEAWSIAERKVVWREAKKYAEQHGLVAPTLNRVKLFEDMACGHTDFGAKWAYGIANDMVA